MAKKIDLGEIMNIPETLLYTENHEWVRIDGEFAFVGITDYAQHEMGNIVFVELPEVGEKITAGDPLGTLEAVKTVEDIFLPVTGEIVKVNTDLAEAPEHINNSPYEEGWLVKVRITNKEDVEKLLRADEYIKLIDK